MYSLSDYGDMIADQARFEAYAKAIAEVVRPGDTVLDLGCGPGPLALLACRAGASRVYAVELGESLGLARELAVANGFADRMIFLAGDSRKLELPERVRVVVSDLRGALPLYDGAILSLEDARKRFLKPGGVLIPQRDTLLAAVIEAGEKYARICAPWTQDGHGLNFSKGRELLLHSIHPIDCKREQLLTEAKPWMILDYASGIGKQVEGTLTLRVLRRGTAHGICVWFDAQVWGQYGYSSGPLAASGARATVYGQILLPWLMPVALEEGQEVIVELHANPVGEDYIWRWNTTVGAAGVGEPLHFVQSSFWGATLSRETLRRKALDYVPMLTEDGQADRCVLEAMNGKQSLEEIARTIVENFPRQSSSFEEALRRVTRLAEKYSR